VADLPADPIDRIETGRLVLRRWQPSDLDALAGVFAEPPVWWYPMRRGLDRDESRQFLDRQIDAADRQGWCLWAAVHRAEERLLGYIGLAVPTFLPEILPAVEVGWRLHPDAWGCGLATEGGRAALASAFDRLGFDSVVSITDRDNLASERVMRRLGMTLDRETVHPQRGIALKVYRADRPVI
jgi:RimJ/RimL family protein N-acetyltransferase